MTGENPANNVFVDEDVKILLLSRKTLCLRLEANSSAALGRLSLRYRNPHGQHGAS
jgi:hypothetical protein